MMNEPSTGTDLELGNRCSKTAYTWAQATFAHRRGLSGAPMMPVAGAYSNLMAYGPVRIAMTSDGIGTKVEIAERTGVYETLGFDLVAMVADDLAANGIEPTNLSNILDVDILDHSIVDSLMKGLHDAASFSRIAVTGGEIAELGGRIGGYGPGMHFNWCATAIGVLSPGREPITGAAISPDDTVITLRSPGFRSNGFSRARRILHEHYGEDWHAQRFGVSSWGTALLTPSVIYSPLVTKILESEIPVGGIAHITGGGVPDNLGRVLRVKGFGAFLDGLYPPAEAMKCLQTLGKIPIETAYRQWNMGNGMLLIVPPSRVDDVLFRAAADGYEARVAGRITESPGIVIRTSPQTELRYAKTSK